MIALGNDVHSYKGSGRCGHDCLVVRFTTIYAIIASHHLSCEFESYSWKGELNTTVCVKFVNDFISYTMQICS